MENKKLTTGRDIIVSKIQIIPFNPIEWDEEFDGLCIAQIAIDRINKTATFEHLSGHKPILDVVIDVLAANKHWLKIVDESDARYEACDYFLMNGPRFYIAHYEDGIFPVFDKPLTEDHEYGIRKVTFTPLEFYLIADWWCLPKSYSSYDLKYHLQQIREELRFKYIR
jgi:hypothetical protein